MTHQTYIRAPETVKTPGADRLSPERSRLRVALDAVERRLFAREDAAALAEGWTVTRTGRGFGRSYRDPRWDARSGGAS